jgi:hypothetical protein
MPAKAKVAMRAMDMPHQWRIQRENTTISYVFQDDLHAHQ